MDRSSILRIPFILSSIVCAPTYARPERADQTPGPRFTRSGREPVTGRRVHDGPAAPRPSTPASAQVERVPPRVRYALIQSST